jgi:hypothetical protein
MSASPSAWNSSASTERIFKKYDDVLFENLSRKFVSSDRNNGCFTWKRTYIYDISFSSSFECEMSKYTVYVQYLFCSLQKSCRLWDNVERNGTARQATDDNTIRWMRFACWIPKGTDTHSEYYLQLFHGNGGYANANHCYVNMYSVCLVLTSYTPSLSKGSSLTKAYII